jgi:hypothetical protein
MFIGGLAGQPREDHPAGDPPDFHRAKPNAASFD